jgi:hypothetical protein
MPDDIPPEAIWTGPPSRLTTVAILVHTVSDSEGRLYYRRSVSDSWQRLRRGDYPELNRVIEQYRRAEGD